MSKVNSIARMYEIMEKFELEQLDKLIMSKEYKDFILSRSPKEVELLNGEYKKRYYEEYRKFVLERKLTNTTPGATNIAPKLKGITTKIAKIVTKKFTNDDIEWISEGQENIPEGPVIFAHTHQGILDNFIWIPEIERHSLLLHSIDTNPLLLLCQVNTGLILIKKGNKEHCANAKMDMVRLLLEGHSITYYPESAWNLSPNKLHLPLTFGIIDIAKKAKVPIIPVAHEYTYDTTQEKETIVKIHSKYGMPIYVKEEDDLFQKLEELSTNWSTMKFELIEKNGVFSRKTITNFEYINFLKGCYKNLEFGKISIENERKHLFRAGDYFYEWNHINDIPFTEDGRFLEPGFETNRVSRYKKKTLEKK